MAVKIINAAEFLSNPDFFLLSGGRDDAEEMAVNAVVTGIINAVRKEGDRAVHRYAAQFEKSVPANAEVPLDTAREEWEKLQSSEPALAGALKTAMDNLRRFGEFQKKQIENFEVELSPGLFAGQRVIPIERAAVYVPAGRFPLISSALMALVPAGLAGVKEKLLVSPPGKNGFPDSRILAAACLAGADRIFALGGAQAIAALALGTETVPKVDLIAGPGNKYVAAAKRLLFGEVGIDFIAGPTDVLVVADGSGGMMEQAAAFAAADMLAQAEHDPDARARALVPSMEMARHIESALEKRLASLPTAEIARASLEKCGLIIVYGPMDEAIRIANRIAPEHLLLQVSPPLEWINRLHNYGSLFIGSGAAEVLGDYSAGINHTLPTSCSSRFSGGLSVRHFFKIVTTLRCAPGTGYENALEAAQAIALAEGLAGHAESAGLRLPAK